MIGTFPVIVATAMATIGKKRRVLMDVIRYSCMHVDLLSGRKDLTRGVLFSSSRANCMLLLEYVIMTAC